MHDACSHHPFPPKIDSAMIYQSTLYTIFTFHSPETPSVPKAIRHRHRSDQTPTINGIANPRTHNLDPTSPIRPAHGREIARVFKVDVLGEQRRDPAGGQQENDVE